MSPSVPESASPLFPWSSTAKGTSAKRPGGGSWPPPRNCTTIPTPTPAICANAAPTPIGVFIAALGGLFYEEILEGIHKVILQTDYELVVCPEARSISRILSNRQVDAAIIFDVKIPTDLLVSLAWKKFPIVVFDCYLEADSVFPLLIDNPGGTRQVFEHLYGQGVRKLAFVAGATDSFDNAERQQTFLNEAHAHGLEVRLYQGDFTEASGYRVAREILASGDLPEAVFCANDQMAIGFLNALRENGLRVPQDVALVGFDDIPIARYLQPPLTTVHVSRTDWGARAAAGLIEYLDRGTPFPAGRVLAHLVVRESSIRDSTTKGAKVTKFFKHCLANVTSPASSAD